MSKPVTSFYGIPASTAVHQFVQGAGVRPAGVGLEYVSPRKGRCEANDDTCNGFRTKGSVLCAGHQNGTREPQ